MILKLRNKKIIIEENSIPSDVHHTPITYDYELGTNHYRTILTIENSTYEGLNPEVNLDYDRNDLNIRVELYDTHSTLMRTYTGTYKYLKLCLIGTDNLMDIYKQLKLLYNENVKLKEQGEVI